MTNQELNEQAQKQQKENEEYLQKILPDVQKEIDGICKKYNVMLGANIIIDRSSIRAIPAITKANQNNPYKQS